MTEPNGGNPNPNPDPNPGDGQGNPDPQGGSNWRDGLDPSIKDHACLQNFKDIKDVVKSYVSVQPLIGKEKIPLPSENATKEEWDVVYSRLGRPASPNDYKLPEVKLPDGFPPIQKEKAEAFKQKAHELGLLPHQLEGLYDWYANDMASEFNAFNESREKSRSEAEVALRNEFGKGFDAKIQLAKGVLEKFGDDNLKSLIDSGLGNDPAMIRFLVNIGSKMGEDGMFTGRQETTMTPEEANAEIRKIQGDKKHPYFNKMHPEHQLAVQRMQELFAMAYPEKSKK